MVGYKEGKGVMDKWNIGRKEFIGRYIGSEGFTKRLHNSGSMIVVVL
jgi:hypothetical protein